MLIFALILTCVMLTVFVTDGLRYVIPNWLVLAILLIYPVMVWRLHVPDWPLAFAIALACFAVGFLIFITKIMGGGDVKLLAAASLYAGKTSILPFIVAVAMLGGVLALLLILGRPLAHYAAGKIGQANRLPRVLMVDQPVPYGLAIAGAFLWLLWSSRIPGIFV